MILVSVRLRNFMRFKKALLNLLKAGMTLIEGVNHDDDSASSNGSGKSSLVDAVTWCLHGATTHDPPATGDEVVNEKFGRDCEVEVKFIVDDRHYAVVRRRCWKRGGKEAQLHFTCAGKDLTKGTMKDTQHAINRVLGLSAATFRHSCVFGQSRAYRFARLTDAEKKAVLDEMLGVELYAQAANRASERNSALQRELERLEAAYNATTTALRDAKRALSELLSWVTNAENAAASRIAKAQNNLTLARKKLEESGGDNIDTKLQETKLQLKQAQKTQIEAGQLRALCHRALTDLKIKRERFINKLDRNCDECAQPVGRAHVERVVEDLDKKIQKTKCELEEALRLDKLAHDAFVEAADARELLEDKSLKVAALRSTVVRCEEALVEAQRDRSAHHGELIAKAEQRVQTLRNKRRDLRAEFEIKQKQQKQLAFWQHGFGTKGLRSLMLDSALPYLNAKLDAYANALTAGNIKIEFKTQRALKSGALRDDLTLEVQNTFGATRYALCSVGERAKIDLIVGLALQDMAATRSKVPINVVFFDEVFDGLDAKGVDRAIQVLSQLKRESAFVISHNDALKTFFSRRITVVKQDGVSRLEAS